MCRNVTVYRTRSDDVNLALTVEKSLKAAWFQKQIQQRHEQHTFIISLVSVTYSAAFIKDLLIQ